MSRGNDCYANGGAVRYALRGMQTTDLLAFRCVAENRILTGKRILDLGCGAGRSSRFLSDLGFRVTGIDCNSEMLAEARRLDPDGDYRLVARGETFPFRDGEFDGIFSSWMLLEEGEDVILGRVLRECRRLLQAQGDAAFITNTLEFYSGQWLSCQTGFPENRPPLKSGQTVKVALLPENLIISDYYRSDEDYRRHFEAAGFTVQEAHKPLGRRSDGVAWVDELHTAPYVVYALG